MRPDRRGRQAGFLVVTPAASKLSTSVATWPSRGLLALIRVYQHIGSPALGALSGPAGGCRFTPTCSHYAAAAVREHGALAGAWLALRRVLKCTPLHAGGFDPVPPRRTPPRCVRVTA